MKKEIENDNSNNFFKIRNKFENLNFDLKGYWSYPIFIKSDKKNTLWMYYISRFESIFNSKDTLIFKPHALLITLPNTTQVVQYQNFKLGLDPFPKIDWGKPIGKFPYNTIGNLTVKEFELKEKELIDLCIQNVDFYNNFENVDEKMKFLYRFLCNPLYENFIKCHSPKFHKIVWG
jgi:hypothetical protein